MERVVYKLHEVLEDVSWQMSLKLDIQFYYTIVAFYTSLIMFHATGCITFTMLMYPGCLYFFLRVYRLVVGGALNI
jgi:hypothetical protein